MRAETCSCYVISINYILCNKIVLDYTFICFIKPFVLLPFPHPASFLPSIDNPFLALHNFGHLRNCSQLLVISLSLQRLYNPVWASASFKSFLHPSRFRATIFQFLHYSLATSKDFYSVSRLVVVLPSVRFSLY